MLNSLASSLHLIHNHQPLVRVSLALQSIYICDMIDPTKISFSSLSKSSTIKNRNYQSDIIMIALTLIIKGFKMS